MELKTKQNVPAIIEFNFEEIKTNLQNYSEKYRDLVVTEDNIKEMTDVKNDLGKLEKQIDSYRLETKKEMEKPIKNFEKKCKDLISVIKEVSDPIRIQLSDFEEKRKREKEEEVKKYIKQTVEEFNLNEKYACQLTITSKYLNKGQKTKDTLEDLKQRAELLKASQEQEEQLLKMREEKINLIQKTIEKKNKEFSINLKISNFMNLIEKESSEILEIIEEKAKETVETLEKEKEDKQEEIYEKVEKKTEKKEEKATFLFTIRDLKKEDVEKIKEFLLDEFYNFEIKKI